MICDLHCHSNCSDGEQDAVLLLEQAAEKNIELFSITDHDTTDAYQDTAFLEARKKLRDKVCVVNGIEISTFWNNTGIHVVGLGVKPDGDAMCEAVRQQQAARKKRAEKIAEKLEKLGLRDVLSETKKIAGKAGIARPHFAQYLVKSGFCKNTEQAFRKYLGAGKCGDVKQEWAPLGRVIEWIRESGGVAVIAHPHKYKMTRTRLQLLAEDFYCAGGQAIEVLSGPEDKRITPMLVQLAQQKNLFSSLGSDFHESGSRWRQLGMHPGLPSGCRPVWELLA